MGLKEAITRNRTEGVSKERKQTDLKRSRYMCRRVGRLGVKEGKGEKMIEKEGAKWEMEIYRKGREKETSEVR